MVTVLHISANGNSWWHKLPGGWQRVNEPGSGHVWVVTDVSEESFVEIAVPRIFGADRSSYIERQLANRFPDTTFRAALEPKRAGSIMDRLAPPIQTLTAIDPSDRLTSVLDTLPNPLAGVWSSSMLLARMGRKSKLPRTMLMVMNQPTGMRIVFLKDRAPVLTRLIGVTTSVGEQAAEILRTLRHLENTRLLERGAQRVPMVLLGVAEQLEPLLRADRLDIVQFRIPRGYTSVSDWRHILFDRVSENPPGQVAPLVRRSTYLAAKLDKGAKIMGGLCLALALLAASPYGLTLFKSERDRLQTQAVIEQLASELANVDAALATFAVSPEALRSALAADNAEIVTAPDLEADLVQISKALTRAGGARVTKLEWRLLSPADTACTKGASDAAPLAPAAELAEGDAATEPARKVEVQLSMLEVPGAGPRLRLQQAIALTQALGEMPGASVMVDPAKRLREGDLSGGDTQADSDRQMNWCLILPGTRAGTGGPAKS